MNGPCSQFIQIDLTFNFVRDLQKMSLSNCLRQPRHRAYPVIHGCIDACIPWFIDSLMHRMSDLLIHGFSGSLQGTRFLRGVCRIVDRLKARNSRPFFTTVLRPKTLTREASGLGSGTLGLHFGVFLEGIYRKWLPFRREKVIHFGTLFGPKSINISKKA